MAEPARRAAVLGTPIAHSLSPALHRAAYASLGLDWTYEAIEVDEAGLAGFLAGLDGSWAGLSLTMPLKEEAARLLADVDPTARALRSVNTVLPGESGWRGTNTDVYGMTQALARAGLAGRPAVRGRPGRGCHGAQRGSRARRAGRAARDRLRPPGRGSDRGRRAGARAGPDGTASPT